MKEVSAAIAEPIRYTVGDLSFTMLGDAPGIMEWITPAGVTKDQVPIAAPLTADTFDDFLACVIAPADAAKVAAAIEDGTFTDKARFDAATEAWYNAQFLSVRSLAQEVLKLQEKLLALNKELPDEDETEQEDGSPLEQG